MAEVSAPSPRATNQHADRPQRIAVFVDGSESADDAFFAALRYRKHSDVLYIVSVPQTVSAPLRGIVFLQSLNDEPLKEASKVIKHHSEELVQFYLKISQERGVPAAGLKGCSLPVTDAAKEKAVEFCTAQQIDVAFVGSRGVSGLQKLFLGSFSEYLVRNAACDVMIVRTRPASAAASITGSAGAIPLSAKDSQ